MEEGAEAASALSAWLDGVRTQAALRSQSVASTSSSDNEHPLLAKLRRV